MEQHVPPAVGSAPSEDPFATSDLDLSAYLAESGAELLEVKPPGADTFPKLARFVFTRSDELEDHLTRWASDQPITLQLRSYLAHRKRLYQHARVVVAGGVR